jgi:hypothetical protein
MNSNRDDWKVRMQKQLAISELSQDLLENRGKARNPLERIQSSS